MHKRFPHMAAAAFFAGLLGAAPAQGEELFSGNYLFPRCQSKDAVDTMVCMSYLRGARDGIEFQQALDKSQAFFCVPDGVTLGQTKDIFVKYLLDNPNDRHLPGSTLFALVMVKTFPCKNGGKK